MASNLPRLFLRSISLSVPPLRQASLLIRTLPKTSRSLITTGPVAKDLIQGLYLKEIKAYNPPPLKQNATEEVKQLSVPPLPQPPTFDEDISADLASYDVDDLEQEEKGQILIESVFEQELFGNLLNEDEPSAESEH
ncbi:hypothetical protein G9A89_011101 [Geosiphon pyriformis]|nr:hypothetical protein G9A89_011101 [Geosiphon pyriformis]